jgi:hypothetical protein
MEVLFVNYNKASGKISSSLIWYLWITELGDSYKTEWYHQEKHRNLHRDIVCIQVHTIHVWGGIIEIKKSWVHPNKKRQRSMKYFSQA